MSRFLQFRVYLDTSLVARGLKKLSPMRSVQIVPGESRLVVTIATGGRLYRAEGLLTEVDVGLREDN